MKECSSSGLQIWTDWKQVHHLHHIHPALLEVRFPTAPK